MRRPGRSQGDIPVRAWIAAMPGWKRAPGRRLDTLVTRTVPGVRKTVKWNSPLCGVAGSGEAAGRFLALRCHAKATLIQNKAA